MVEWYIDYFGRAPDEEPEGILRIEPGQTVYVQIISDDVEMVDTRKGKMPRILVMHEGKTYILWLNRRDLARPIALYQKKGGKIKGKHLKIRCEPIDERRVRYHVEIIES